MLPCGRTGIVINIVCSSICIKSTFPATGERAGFIPMNRTRASCIVGGRHRKRAVGARLMSERQGCL